MVFIDVVLINYIAHTQPRARSPVVVFFVFLCIRMRRHNVCSINGDPVDIDPECVSHDDYLTEFKSMLITALRNVIDADTANDPDCIKGRKKTVQVSEFRFFFISPHNNTE